MSWASQRAVAEAADGDGVAGGFGDGEVGGDCGAGGAGDSVTGASLTVNHERNKHQHTYNYRHQHFALLRNAHYFDCDQFSEPIANFTSL